MGTFGGKLGCAAATLIVIAIALPVAFALSFGDCVPSVDCHAGDGWRFLSIVAPLVPVAGVVGILVRWCVNHVASPEQGKTLPEWLMGCVIAVVLTAAAVWLAWQALWSFAAS
jgi:type III secretory pathway component EscS